MLANKTMTADELKATIFRLLGQIAPEAEFSTLKPTQDLREALDIDSFDYLNFLIALAEEVGVEIPEKDYGQVSTLSGLVDYVMTHAG